VKPVKLGEGPEALSARADAEPSPARLAPGRCREQTAGTYGRHGHGEGVLQTTNPVTHVRRGGESRSGTKIRRPEKRVGSTPTSGTTSASADDCHRRITASIAR
jgi:hypothetical protein